MIDVFVKKSGKILLKKCAHYKKKYYISLIE